MPLAITKKNLLKGFLKEHFGISSALVWTLIFKVWLLLKGPASLFFLIIFLSPKEQGYWYVFINLSALALFAELGFNTMITQFVSHEYALLKFESGKIDGPRYNIDRIFGLIKYALKFYAIVIPAAVIVMWIFGYVVLIKEKQLWVIVAWFIYSALGAGSLLLSLAQYIYQGLDKVEDIQKNILLGSVSMTLCTWALLALGFKIWALVMGNFIGLITMAIFLVKKTNKFWMQALRHKTSYMFDWFKEIGRLQARYAVSFTGGLFIASFITPIVMYFQGPLVAGRVGMTLSIVASLLSVSTAWGMVNIPQFNILVAQNNRELLDKLFKNIQRQSSLVFLAGGFFLSLLLIFIFPLLHWKERLLPLSDFLILLAAGLLTVRSSNMALYLRAHKEEPYMWLSVINGVMTTSLVIISLYFFNSSSMAIAGYAFTQIVIASAAYLVFTGKKREYASQLSLVNFNYE